MFLFGGDADSHIDRVQESHVADTDVAGVLADIRQEGLENSRVMAIASQLTDQFGPRLTGSPSLERAGDWALALMNDRGASKVWKEGWDFGHPGWENEQLSIHLISPVKESLVGEVLAWTPGTPGTVTAGVVHLMPPTAGSEQDFDNYLRPFADRVRNRIVLVGSTEIIPFEQAHAGHVDRDSDPPGLTPREIDQYISDFLAENNAAVRVNNAAMPDGLIRAFGNRTFDQERAVPTVILRAEDYGRLVRLHRRGQPVELEIDVENNWYPAGRTAYNYLAEIEGTDVSDEVVMLGGHLDSWHAATGATDNAAGSAVMLEAMRILLDMDVRPRRTIRLALWSGEEQGLLGSKAYVARHFGSVERPAGEFNSVAGYVNVDTGTGRLESALVYGPPSAADMLTSFFKPLNDLGITEAVATDSRISGGSDHTTFNAAGLPGISMVQDPVRYRSHTWHTNIDTFEQLLPDHLKQAAVVVASTVYQLAMSESMIPRLED